MRQEDAAARNHHTYSCRKHWVKSSVRHIGHVHDANPIFCVFFNPTLYCNCDAQRSRDRSGAGQCQPLMGGGTSAAIEWLGGVGSIQVGSRVNKGSKHELLSWREGQFERLVKKNYKSEGP